MPDDDDERETMTHSLHQRLSLSLSQYINIISPLIQTPHTTNTTQQPPTSYDGLQTQQERRHNPLHSKRFWTETQQPNRERENDKPMMCPKFWHTESHTTTDLVSISSLFVLVIATVNIIGTCCCCLRLSSVSHASMRPIALCPGLFPSPGWPHTAEQEQTNCLDGPST